MPLNRLRVLHVSAKQSLMVTLILSVLSSCVFDASSQAAPVTLQFDAEVSSVPAGTPFELPISFEVGDVVRGRITFEPEQAASGSHRLESLQSLGTEIDINGQTIGSQTYFIQALNDTFIDDAFPFNVDTLTLGCSLSSRATCMPATIEIPGAEPFEIAFLMELWGPADVVDSPSIAVAPEVWNDYDLFRRLIVYFGGIDSGGLSFHADVRDFEVAPEPSTISSILLFASMLGSPRSSGCLTVAASNRRTRRWWQNGH